jgi:hypothetical protein
MNMKQKCLKVINEYHDEQATEANHCSYLSSEDLWEQVLDTQLHPFLREPALFELARRGDEGLYNLCECKMLLNDVEEWFLAVLALRELGTAQAIERLLLHASDCEPSRKRIILSEVATILRSEQREDFIEMADMFGVPGILDVSRWTLPALSALSEICNCHSVHLVPLEKSASEKCPFCLTSGQNKQIGHIQA